MRRVMFLTTDERGLWEKGEVAEDLGWESSHPGAARIRLLKLAHGEVIALHDPFARKLITTLRPTQN